LALTAVITTSAPIIVSKIVIDLESMKLIKKGRTAALSFCWGGSLRAASLMAGIKPVLWRKMLL
jgi:hypothetical protein